VSFVEIVSYAMGEGAGYDEGYKAGEESSTAYQDGYSAGETAGYNSGYSVGYDEGVASVNSIKTLIEARGNVISLFNGLQPDNNENIDQKIARLLNYSDTENISNFNSMLQNCKATIIPSFDTHNAESFVNFFDSSNTIVNAGTLKTYNATNLSALCVNCENLKSIYIDNNENISYNLSRAFLGCTKLNNLTFKNTPKVSSDTNAFERAFYNAYLRDGAFPYIDTSAVVSFSYSFAADINKQTFVMQSIPLYDLSGADVDIGLRDIFDYRKIYEIPNLVLPDMTERQWNTYFSSKSGTDYFFKGNNALGKLGFKNIRYKLDVSVSTAFTRDTLNEIIGNLVDRTGSTAKTLVIGSTNLAKLTDEDIAVATAKNWTVA